MVSRLKKRFDYLYVRFKVLINHFGAIRTISEHYLEVHNRNRMTIVSMFKSEFNLDKRWKRGH